MNIQKRQAVKGIIYKILKYKGISLRDFLRQIGYNFSYYERVIEEDKLSVHRLLDIIIEADMKICIGIFNSEEKLIKKISGIDVMKISEKMGKLSLKLIKKYHKTIFLFKQHYELFDSASLIKSQIDIKSKSSLDHIINYIEALGYTVKVKAELKK